MAENNYCINNLIIGLPNFKLELWKSIELTEHLKNILTSTTIQNFDIKIIQKTYLLTVIY